jgi:hypothetical protein
MPTTRVIQVYTMRDGHTVAVIEQRRRGKDADHPPGRRWVITEVGGQCWSFETVFAALEHVNKRYSAVNFRIERVTS